MNQALRVQSGLCNSDLMIGRAYCGLTNHYLHLAYIYIYVSISCESFHPSYIYIYIYIMTKHQDGGWQSINEGNPDLKAIEKANELVKKEVANHSLL